MNHDLSLLVQWLRLNKVSLNTSKTEILIFRPKGKSITKHFNFRISGEKINTSSTANYLGVLLHENLQWQIHIDSLIAKFSRFIGLLSKIRYYVPKYLLRTIYFSIFNSHMIYTCQVGDKMKQKYNNELQDKALRIINFKPKNHLVSELCKSNKILKLTDYIKLLNCMFVKDTLSANQIPIFNNFFLKKQ